MNEMIGYICNEMGHTRNTLHKQRIVNRNLFLLAAATATYAYLVARNQQKQQEKIKDLARKVEELKGEKGDSGM